MAGHCPVDCGLRPALCYLCAVLSVSVIIVTYNRVAQLRRCLTAATALDYDDYEIIVVDDGSTDGTGDMVQRIFPQVRYLGQPANIGEPAVRNRGLRAARGDLIAFTDDDCVAPRDWLRRHTRYYADPRIGAVGGPQIAATPNFYDHFESAQYGMHLDTLQQIDRVDAFDHLITGNLSVRRTVIDRVGCFDERFRVDGADADLIRRIGHAGYSFIRDPDLQVAHLKVYHLRSYLAMRCRRAVGCVLIDAKEGTQSARRFIPLPNITRTRDNWRRFRREVHGGAGVWLRFWGFAVLSRWCDVAGRAYYSWRLGGVMSSAMGVPSTSGSGTPKSVPMVGAKSMTPTGRPSGPAPSPAPEAKNKPSGL